MANLKFRNITQPKEIWSLFYSECKGQLLIISKASKDPNLLKNNLSEHKLSHHLHRIKGSLGFIGLMEMAEQVKACENHLKNEDANLASALKDLARQLSYLIDELSALLEN